jgi:hypothetical protein
MTMLNTLAFIVGSVLAVFVVFAVALVVWP